MANAIYPVSAVVPRDVAPIGEAARDLIVDNFPGDSLIVARDDAEELKKWPLRRKKVAREGAIGVCYSVVVTLRPTKDYGALGLLAVTYLPRQISPATCRGPRANLPSFCTIFFHDFIA